MLNQVQLIGFTGAEPEIRSTQGGKKVATLRVCTSRYTKKNGERKDYPTWHQVEIWNAATVNWLASKGLAKGAKVFVQGEIRHDRYRRAALSRRAHLLASAGAVPRAEAPSPRLSPYGPFRRLRSASVGCPARRPPGRPVQLSPHQ